MMNPRGDVLERCQDSIDSRRRQFSLLVNMVEETLGCCFGPLVRMFGAGRLHQIADELLQVAFLRLERVGLRVTGFDAEVEFEPGQQAVLFPPGQERSSFRLDGDEHRLRRRGSYPAAWQYFHRAATRKAGRGIVEEPRPVRQDEV